MFIPLGVLQHTPDVFGAFLSLPPMLEPGGKICVDYYEKTWKSIMLPKYFLRPITKKYSKTFFIQNIANTNPIFIII